MNEMSGSTSKLYALLIILMLILSGNKTYTIGLEGNDMPLYLEYTVLSQIVFIVYQDSVGRWVHTTLNIVEGSMLRLDILRDSDGTVNLDLKLDLNIKDGGINGEITSISLNGSRLLVYSNYLYIGQYQVGFSPFYFDIPVTFDYLLSLNSNPTYLGHVLQYPQKPVWIEGYMGFNVVYLFSKGVLESIKLTQSSIEETLTRLAIYEAEIRGRIPVMVSVLLPVEIFDPISLTYLLDIVGSGINGSVVDRLTPRYIHLTYGLSTNFVNSFIEVINNEPICVEMCPSTGIALESLLLIVVLAAIIAIVVMVRRVGL